jgi:hypothetical protein
MIFKGQSVYKHINVGSSRMCRINTKTEHFLISSSSGHMRKKKRNDERKDNQWIFNQYSWIDKMKGEMHY